MKYTFTYTVSEDKTPTLIITRDMNWLAGSSSDIVKVFTGEEATSLYNKLTEKE